MNPTPESRLLELYDRVADAPDAVARLRKFVLDLAVRGKLVEQDPEDEPAAELLRSHTSVEHIDRPHFPHGWAKAPIGQLLNFRYGKGLKKSERLESGPVPVFGSNGIVGYTETPLTGNPAIIIGRKGSAGALNLSEGASWTTDVAYYVEIPEFFQAKFLFIMLRTLELEKLGKGVKPGLSRADAYELELAVPPLPEQHRIVAKLDELMALLDRLEATRTQRETTRDHLTTASLARLTAPETAEKEFRAHTRFALDYLTQLTTRPEQIKTLRQTILNLAVRGKLQSGASGEIRTIGKFRKLQNGYAFKSTWFAKSGIRLLRNANIGHGEVHWDNVVYLPVKRAEEFERFRLRKGDIVLALDRPFIVTGTKVARIKNADLPSLLLQRVGRFVETAQGLSDDYLFLWVNSPHFNEQIDPGRSNGVPHISSKQVETAEIYVPPLAEQRRIVAKVDSFMALCDRLEAALASANTTSACLLKTLLHDALNVNVRGKEAA